jgi:glycosyltransferase involved in cell wall biosynthesis
VDARVIAPGVDLAAFAPGPGRATEPTILCAADHRQPRKRVDLLLEAFSRVRRERPGARLLLDAPAPTAPGVQARDLSDTAALAAANREAWVHALPSVGEAFGLVLAEALACGTPVVGPNPELVADPATGVLFTGDDPGELARALLTALDLGDVSAACRARAQAFSTDATSDAYVALYEELRPGCGRSRR